MADVHTVLFGFWTDACLVNRLATEQQQIHLSADYRNWWDVEAVAGVSKIRNGSKIDGDDAPKAEF